MDCRYVTRERKTGCIIDGFHDAASAVWEIYKYEEKDKRNGNYEEDFYEVWDTVNEEVVE